MREVCRARWMHVIRKSAAEPLLRSSVLQLLLPTLPSIFRII